MLNAPPWAFREQCGDMSSEQPKIMLIDEMIAGKYWTVLIDDTGSPGEKNHLFLPHDRITWAAVLVPPDKGREFFLGITKLLKLVHSNTGAQELHFVDIFGGRREFEGKSIELRMRIFKALVWLLNHCNCKILIQSLTTQERKKMG
jgi:hypothetical protein